MGFVHPPNGLGRAEVRLVPLLWNGMQCLKLPSWAFRHFRIVVMLRQRAARLVFAGFCLAALPGMPAWLLAAETREPPSSEGHAFDAEPMNEGGALYSPFSTATQPSARPTPAAQPASSSPTAAQVSDDESPGLVTASITVLLAAGGLAVLVRLLAAG